MLKPLPTPSIIVRDESGNIINRNEVRANVSGTIAAGAVFIGELNRIGTTIPTEILDPQPANPSASS
jgi:hypothetical protein